jgi:hypothetical protein
MKLFVTWQIVAFNRFSKTCQIWALLCLIFETEKLQYFPGVCLSKRNIFFYLLFLSPTFWVFWTPLCLIFLIVKINDFPGFLSPRGAFFVFKIFFYDAPLYNFWIPFCVAFEMKNNFPGVFSPRGTFLLYLPCSYTTRRLEETGWDGRTDWRTFGCNVLYWWECELSWVYPHHLH